MARGITAKEDRMKTRTEEQIAARRAKSKARREAKKAVIPNNESNLEKLKSNFKALLAKFERGELTIKEAGSLWVVPKSNFSSLTSEQLEAKIAKEKAKLARLEQALRG